MIARVLYGMAEKEMAPHLFGRVNPKTKAPIGPTIISIVVILALALLFNLESLAKATNYILISVFIMINLALWRLKKREAHPKGIRVYPRAVPVIGFFLSLGLLIFQIVYALGNL
ncbi:MAG TPA: hypothetical protein DDY13_09455 [Cytophagales bacterium]|jgi:APA family basic amino acid/polyamine antiporter|nr:hypothetical protein [Cytophagales bacterium]